MNILIMAVISWLHMEYVPKAYITLIMVAIFGSLTIRGFIRNRKARIREKERRKRDEA